MSTLTEEQKQTMKEQRLNQYSQQIFFLEMDVAALSSVGLVIEVTKKSKEIESIKAAYTAVEKM